MTTQAAGFEDFDRRARAGEPLNVVFFGGSLTWGANSSNPQLTSYRALMGEYLRQKYPKSSFAFYDAAIGGTGSKLGIFRIERDVLSRKPDLVFLDFMLNDGLIDPDPRTEGSYEVLLRDLTARGIPIMQVFLGGKNEFVKYAPEKILGYQQKRKLVEPYRTGEGDAIVYIHEQLEAGKADLATLWQPYDSTHPDDAGYRLYFEAVRDGYERAVAEKLAGALPEKPVYSDEWKDRTRRILVEGPLPAGWSRAVTYRTGMWFDGQSSRWMGDVAMCDIKDREKVQPLKIDFAGTFLGVFGEGDHDGLGFRVLIDGKPVPQVVNGRPSEVWNFKPPVGPGRLFVWRVLSDDLEPGRHTLEIQPVFPEGAEKGQLRIESICFAGP